ncbi:MAG: hypothetical protein Q4C88_05970 [Akkermansia sp.]|nr:hypothetical protein [Akkermansia sp.]
MQVVTTTIKLLLHVAALAFVLWLVTGGPLWKGRPADLPAVRTISNVIVDT